MGEIKIDGFLCERCEHKWIGRNGTKPIVCPKCKSPYWNSPRKKPVEKREKISKEEASFESCFFQNKSLKKGGFFPWEK